MVCKIANDFTESKAAIGAPYSVAICNLAACLSQKPKTACDMKALNVIWVTSLLLMAMSCKQSTPAVADKPADEQPALAELTAPGIFSAEIMWRLGRISDIQVSPDGKQVLFGITRYRLDENKGNRDLYLLPVEGGDMLRLTDSPGSELNACWRPDGQKIGYLSAESGSMQLWEMNPDGSSKVQRSDIPDGISGFAYSPDIRNILYTKDVKIDKTPQESHPDLPLSNAMIMDDMMYRHWDHWHDYAYSHVFFSSYDPSVMISEGTDLMPGEPFDSPMLPHGGLEQISWSPDGKAIAYTCKKLKGKAYTLSTNSEIYLYQLEDGSTTNLSENGFDGYDWDPVFSPDGRYLVWRSMEEPGFEADKERIILYDMATAQTSDLTEGFDQSSTHYRWSPDGQKLFFISGIHATYQIYEMELATRKIRQITQGDHDYQAVELAGDVLIGQKMSMSLPSEIFVIDPNSGEERQLSYVNKEILDKLTLASIQKRWIKTTDGKEMLTWVILPPNFDSTKSYPALLYCQGGPQSAVSQFFSYRWNFQMMAANGYIVVAPNRRGLPTFGQEWNDQISGDYGGQNIRDYLSAIDAVSAEPYVDKARLGAVGASYGGFSVFYLAGHHEKRFSAFISHCGMFNLESQYASTEEYFFPNKDLGGAYWEKPRPKSYDYSPHRFVDKWDTPIMIIHGGYDFRIPYTESLQAFNAAQLRGVPSRLLFFPEESHFVLKPQNSVLWQREFFRWLDQYLK